MGNTHKPTLMIDAKKPARWYLNDNQTSKLQSFVTVEGFCVRKWRKNAQEIDLEKSA